MRVIYNHAVSGAGTDDYSQSQIPVDKSNERGGQTKGKPTVASENR